MRILIAGDFCDKLRVSENIAKGDYASMFNEVKPYTEQADFSIVNFEFPIVTTDGMAIKKCGPNLKGQIKSVEAIKYAGFNVCTLANNHILDQGVECCLATQRLLEDSNIKTVGVGENVEKASAILYLKKGSETLAIINCCEHEFSLATESTPGANPLIPIHQYYKIKEAKEKATYVIVIVHGGHEMFQYPSPRMVETYRFFIDAGADAVINHHQHCFSGYEKYNGKPIFYGLGNLLFDHKTYRNGIWNEGFMVELTLSSDKEPKYNIVPYTQCQEFVGVHVLADVFLYNERIKEINGIIANQRSLEQKYNEWIGKSERYSMAIFTPYNNRYLLGLYKRGLLPSFISNRKLLHIYNDILCESHLDKIKTTLNRKYLK